MDGVVVDVDDRAIAMAVMELIPDATLDANGFLQVRDEAAGAQPAANEAPGDQAYDLITRVIWRNQAYDLIQGRGGEDDGDTDGSEDFALPVPRLPAVDPLRNTFRSRVGHHDGDGDDSEHFALPVPRLPAVDPLRSTFRSRVGRGDGRPYGGYNNGHGGFQEGGAVMGLAAPTAAAMMKLEKVKYGEAGAREGTSTSTSADGVTCAICIQDYETGDELSVVPCSGRHRFHAGCLAVWVARKRSCPLCRHALSS